MPALSSHRACAALALAAGTALLLSGCPSEKPQASASPTATAAATVEASGRPTPSPSGSAFNPAAIKPDKGSYDTATGMLTAIGKGFPPDRAGSRAQGRLLAERAARAVALRTVLFNYQALTGKQANSRVEHGLISNAHEVSKRYGADGSVTITLKVHISDVQ